jgi:hypothetical protein
LDVGCDAGAHGLYNSYDATADRYRFTCGGKPATLFNAPQFRHDALCPKG